MCRKAIGEFCSIVCLDTFNGTGECLYQMLDKLCGRIGAVFFKGFYETPSGIFIDRSILKEPLSNNPAVHKAGRRDKFNIHLNTLSRMIHLLIGLGDILGVGRMDGHDTLFFEKAIEPRNGAGVTALSKLHPEDNKTGIGIASAHIHDELDFFRSMLIRMVMWAAGTVPKGLDRTVKTAFPAVNVLPVCFIFNGSLCDTIFISKTNQG